MCMCSTYIIRCCALCYSVAQYDKIWKNVLLYLKCPGLYYIYIDQGIHKGKNEIAQNKKTSWDFLFKRDIGSKYICYLGNFFKKSSLKKDWTKFQYFSLEFAFGLKLTDCRAPHISHQKN